MNTWNRPLWGLLGIMGCMVVVGLAHSRGPADRDILSLFSPWEQESAQEVLRLSRSKVVQERIRAKGEVVRNLLDHKLTLFEAAAWFRFLNENPCECQDDYRSKFPGNSDSEKLCRQVIAWVKQELQVGDSPDRTHLEVERLEDELGSHLSLNGTVKLPAW